MELIIDQVIVTDEEVEIRYLIPPIRAANMHVFVT